MCFLSLYVPPGEHNRVISELAAALALDDVPLFSAGDANLQLQQPREGEEDAVAALRGLLASRGSVTVDYTGPSYFGRERGSSIDFASVPADGAWRWHAQVQRRNGLSDHGCLLLGDAARPVSAARALTPATFRCLPAEAREDLRRRFVLLVPRLPGLMYSGRAALSAVIAKWWRDWRCRRPPPSLGALLEEAARAPGPFTPSGPLAVWLTLLEWAGAPLGTRCFTRLARHLERGATPSSRCRPAALGARPRGLSAGSA